MARKMLTTKGTLWLPLQTALEGQCNLPASAFFVSSCHCATAVCDKVATW